MTEQSGVPVKKKSNVGTKIIVWLVLLVAAAIAYFVLAAVLPLTGKHAAAPEDRPEDGPKA